MTTIEIVGCAVSGVAAIVAVTALALTVRRARHTTIRWEIEDGVITFDRKLTEAEVEQFKTEWTRRYGRVKDGNVCAHYRPPTRLEDSGCCARCGMSDYQHAKERL